MSEARLSRMWSSKDGKYLLMPEEGEDVSIVADPDATHTQRDDGDDTLADDDNENEENEETFDFEDSSADLTSALSHTKSPSQLTLRARLMRVVNSIWWQGPVFLLIILDVILLIIQMYGFYGDTAEAERLNDMFAPGSPLTGLSLAIVIVLLFEVLLRLLVLGKHFWKDRLNIFDLIVMFVSFILAIVVEEKVVGGFLVLLRAIRVATRVARVVIKVMQGKRNLNKAVRHVVTENKMRYTQDGWDLDLAYITNRVMVTSLPAWDYRSLFRNHIDDVVRFLDTLHPDQYIVVNCCAEDYANYPISKFHNRVKRFLVEDHNTATLKQLVEACEYIDEWMQNPSNVAVVHCKGGKGRSGSMICAYLLYSGVCATGDEALELFGQKRTDHTKPGRIQGVETASQKRYVEYFSALVRAGKVLPNRVRLYITKFSVRLISPDNLQGRYQLAPFASITHNDGKPTANIKLRKKSEQYDMAGLNAVEYEGLRVELVDDVRLMVFLEEKKAGPNGKKREIYFFYFWFHTAYMSDNLPFMLSKTEVDRNRKWKNSPFGKLKSLTVEVHFAPVVSIN